MPTRRAFGLAAVLLAAALACNLQASTDNSEELAAMVTANALTLESRAGSAAAGTQAAPPRTEARIISPAACREGPGQAYALVFTADVGQSFKLVGKNTATNQWIVENPAGGLCWFQAQGVEASGDTSRLPEHPVPAAPTAGPTRTPQPTRASKTPRPSPVPTLTFTATIGVPYTPGVPNFPIHFIASPSCAVYVENDGRWFIQATTLTWEDRADNETGYRIYRRRTDEISEGLVANLGPNVTRFSYTERYHEGMLKKSPYAEYYLYAYNDVGYSIKMGLVLDYCK